MDDKRDIKGGEDKRSRNGEALVVKALAKYFGCSPGEKPGSNSGESLIFSSLKRYFSNRR